MPDVARVLREEVQRLAKRQVKAGLAPLKRDTVRLKKHVADLRRELTALTRAGRELLAKVTAVVATKETEAATARAATLRPTSKSLVRLRRRLGLTQVEFGRLMGVSGQAVLNWERKGSWFGCGVQISRPSRASRRWASGRPVGGWRRWTKAASVGRIALFSPPTHWAIRGLTRRVSASTTNAFWTTSAGSL